MRIRAALSFAMLLLDLLTCGGLQSAEPEVQADPNLHFEILLAQSSILECEPLVLRVRVTNRGKEPITLRECLARCDWEENLKLTVGDRNATTRFNYGGHSYVTHCGRFGDVVLNPQESQEQVCESSEFPEATFAAAGQYPIQARFHSTSGVLTATALVRVTAPTGEDAVVCRQLQEFELAPYLASSGHLALRSRLEYPTSIPARQQLRQAIRICREHGGSKYAPYLLSSMICLAYVEYKGLFEDSPEKLLTKEEVEKLLDFARSYNQQFPHARTTLCLAESMTYRTSAPGLQCDDPTEARRLLTRAAALKPDPLVAQRIGWNMSHLAAPATQAGTLMP